MYFIVNKMIKIKLLRTRQQYAGKRMYGEPVKFDVALCDYTESIQ